MGFFDKVKSAAGSGVARLEVDIKSRPAKRGDVLQALIRVSPGERNLDLNYIRVSFEYEGKWQIPSADGVAIQIEGKARMWFGDIEASKGRKLQPGQPAVEIPFEWRVPTDSPLSGSDVKYKLWVRADVEDMKDPEFSTSFDITG